MLHGISNAIARQPSSLEFLGTPASTRKAVRAGTHRTLGLEETLQRACRDAERAKVTRVADITGLDRLGLPVFSSVRPEAEHGNNTVTNGKGSTHLAARVSALLEAIERFAGERNGRHGPVLSFRECVQEGLCAIDPHDLVLSFDNDYSEEASIEWWSSRDLISGEEVLAPAAAVLFPHLLSPLLFLSDTNGLASGNSLPEALCHALLEVLERDATAFGETLREGVRLDLDSVEDPEARRMLSCFEAADVDIHVHVMTTDIGVPTFHVIADDRVRRDAMFLNGGFGCHLDPRVGLSRALTEAAQSRATVLSGAREDLDRETDRQRVGYDELRRRHAWCFDRRAPLLRLADIPDLSTQTIADDLALILARLRAANFQRVLAVDLTVPGLETAVVRAVVPGAENVSHNNQRYGQRLARAARRLARLRDGAA